MNSVREVGNIFSFSFNLTKKERKRERERERERKRGSTRGTLEKVTWHTTISLTIWLPYPTSQYPSSPHSTLFARSHVVAGCEESLRILQRILFSFYHCSKPSTRKLEEFSEQTSKEVPGIELTGTIRIINRNENVTAIIGTVWGSAWSDIKERNGRRRGREEGEIPFEKI